MEPDVTNTLLKKLDGIEQLLLSQKKVLTFKEALAYTDLSKSYLYKLTSRNQIPFHRPNGKQIYFSIEDLNNYLLRNRVRSTYEVELQVNTEATLKAVRNTI